MSGFEAGLDQVLPDQGQLLHARAEQVDALPAGDLGVQAETLRHAAQHDQLVRRDFAARHARHHRVGAVLLHVRQIVVVGVLQAGELGLEDMLVPGGRQDAGDGRLADVATAPLAVLDQHVIESLELAQLDQVEQLLARVGEVFAEMIVDGDAAALEFRIQHLLEQGCATTAGGCRLGAFLECGDGGGASLDGGTQRALGHGVAGADQRTVRQHVHAQAGLAATARRQDQILGMLRQIDAVERELQQIAVVLGIADQHRAEQPLPVRRHHQFLVAAGGFVGEYVVERARRGAVRVADRGYVHAQQFELGAHIGAGEFHRSRQGAVVARGGRLGIEFNFGVR